MALEFGVIPGLRGRGRSEEPAVDAFGVPFLAAIPAIAAGISAAATAGGAVTGTVASIVSAVRAAESQEIKDARERGASPAEIRAIRKRWRAEQKRRTAAARKARKRGKGRKVAKPKRKMTEAERQAQALEVARGFQTGAVIGTTSADVLHRVGLGIQEAATGASVDPWTGQAAVHPVVAMPPPAVPPGDGFLMRPVLGPIPGWGVLLGGLLLLGGAAVALRK